MGRPKAKKRELTAIAVPATERPKWRKIYKGKIYTFRGTYAEALTAWQAKRAELVEAQPQPRPQPKDEEPRFASFGDTNPAHFAPVGKVFANAEELREYVDQRKRAVDDALKSLDLQATAPTTIGQGVDLFIASMETRATAGEISVGYFELLDRCLNHFADTVGRRIAIKNINGMLLTGYHAELLKKRQDWSPDYIDGYLRSMTRFVRWCWKAELLETLPRNLGTQDLSIKKGLKKVKPWLDEDITTVLSHASERTQLYLLLMLNCGFTQKDLSDLDNGELDWEKGRIVRKRGKTARFENVPEVEWKLWPETLKLLEKFGNKSGRVLANEDGGQLLVHEFRTVDGKRKVTKVDNIAVAFGRLLRKLKTKSLLKSPKSLKFFRKTSHSKIGNNPQFAHLKTYFLGHSAKTVADQSYFALDHDAFDKAIDWLRGEYHIANAASVFFPTG
jgi:integrase